MSHNYEIACTLINHSECIAPTHLLDDVVITSDLSTAFKDVNYNFLVGAKPRGPGMERGDLLKDNGAIFVDVDDF